MKSSLPCLLQSWSLTLESPRPSMAMSPNHYVALLAPTSDLTPAVPALRFPHKDPALYKGSPPWQQTCLAQ